MDLLWSASIKGSAQLLTHYIFFTLDFIHRVRSYRAGFATKNLNRAPDNCSGRKRNEVKICKRNPPVNSTSGKCGHLYTYIFKSNAQGAQ